MANPSERFSRQPFDQQKREGQTFAEFRLPPHYMNVLGGALSEPLLLSGTSRRFRLDGAGYWGINDIQTSKETAGIFHHSVLSARYSLLLGKDLLRNHANGTFHLQNPPDLQVLGEQMLYSHLGTLAGSEARNHTDIVATVLGPQGRFEAERRRDITFEMLGLEFLQRHVPDKVSEEVFNGVAALGHHTEEFGIDPSIYNGLNYRIASYVDHRTTDKWEPYHGRMGDFLAKNFIEGTDEEKDAIKGKIRTQIQQLFDQQKSYYANGSDQVNLDYAEHALGQLGVQSGSERRTTRRHVLNLILEDAQTEVLLQQAGIDIEGTIAGDTNPSPFYEFGWENDIRNEYVRAAADSIITRIDEIRSTIPVGRQGSPNDNSLWALDAPEIVKEFPTEGGLGWWNKIALSFYRQIHRDQFSTAYLTADPLGREEPGGWGETRRRYFDSPILNPEVWGEQ